VARPSSLTVVAGLRPATSRPRSPRYLSLAPPYHQSAPRWCRSFRRCAAYATVRQWLAIHLADEGRHDEAAEEIERARRLDPLSRIINTAAGAIRYFARDYDGAIAEYRSVVDHAPDFALGWALMGCVFLVHGQLDSAVATLGRAVKLSGGDPSYQAVYKLRLSGRAGRRRFEGSTTFREVSAFIRVPHDHRDVVANGPDNRRPMGAPVGRPADPRAVPEVP
jgi:tetratricopeptide (TPR) repeat protein